MGWVVWTLFFFFSSRRRHTRSLRDEFRRVLFRSPLERAPWRDRFDGMSATMVEKADSAERGGPILPRARELAPERGAVTACTRSEERRVGKSVELGGRGSKNKKK